ncbi:MAG: trypsin-like peptidase domain-containing protein [Cyanobacteria bacterium P01_D01_bin.73]
MPNNSKLAIARIFGNGEGEDREVVGTGFLVAPGYVITCAHVVLQATGIERGEFSDLKHEAMPTAEISLDFPVEANRKPLRAKVVFWEPYALDSGDIAGLKLLDLVPSAAIEPIRVLPMEPCEQSDRCVAYGFGDDSGGESDAYYPRAQVAGKRWQLYKTGAENDDRIRSGFSGSPVFKRSQNQSSEDEYVAGMIATAQIGGDKSVSKAYAIPHEVLQDAIETLFVHRLYDLVEEFRRQHPSNRWDSWIERAFKYCEACHSGEDLSLDLLPRLRKLLNYGTRAWKADDGQEVDRLTQWALFLALEDVPDLNLMLDGWAKSRGSLPFDRLYMEADNRKKKRNEAMGDFRCVLVEVEEDLRVDASPDGVTVKILGIDDEGDEHEVTSGRAVELSKLGEFIDIELEVNTKFTEGEIHLFAPKKWISQGFELLSLGDAGASLGSEYALLMRCNEPFSTRYRKRLEEKWAALQQCQGKTAEEVFKDFNCCDSAAEIAALKSAEALVLKNVGEDSCTSIVRHRRVAFPLILWARRGDLSDRIRPELLGGSVCVSGLPEHIRAFREEASDGSDSSTGENRDRLGRHLSLVWQDPNLTPSSWERLG